MKEIWKDIPDYEGIYQASNFGRIKRVKTGRILGQTNISGYLRVALNNNNCSRSFMVHRLVALAFIPNIENLPCVNHKDEVKSNNNINNLEWCTHRYNSNYGTIAERLSIINGKPVIQTTKKGDFIKEYPSARQAQRETGIDNAHISECANTHLKSAGGFLWKWSGKNIYWNDYVI